MIPGSFLTERFESALPTKDMYICRGISGSDAHSTMYNNMTFPVFDDMLFFRNHRLRDLLTNS